MKFKLSRSTVALKDIRLKYGLGRVKVHSMKRKSIVSAARTQMLQTQFYCAMHVESRFNKSTYEKLNNRSLLENN